MRFDLGETHARATAIGVLLLLALCVTAGPVAAQVPGDCPPTDLSVVLNTGWDQSTGGAPIATGNPDDDWDVTVDAGGGTVPRDANVINSHPAWLTLPDSKWISAAATGPNGTYVYEICWCLDDSFLNPLLSFDARADDQADFFLNGTPIGSTPNGSFNDTIPTSVSVANPALFVVGQNCLTAEVHNLYGVVTGLNLAGTLTADDGLCCACDADPLNDDASTGVDDASGGPIVTGNPDDEWVVTVAPSGPTPRPADVIDSFQTWDTIAGTKWVSGDTAAPNGTYVYEKCWTMNESFGNPTLQVDLLADNQADVFLNGNYLGSTPQQQAWRLPATVLSTSNPSLFRGGRNCVRISVSNTDRTATGIDASVTIVADDALPCPCFELPTDAEAWWPLDETSGTTAFEPLNAHNGTHTELGGPSGPPPTPAPGYVDGALQFDGVNDYVEVPDDPGLDFDAADDLTIDAWINTDNNQREPIVHKKNRDFNDPGYEFSVSAGFLSFEMADGASTIVCLGSGGLDDNAWHFVAVTVDRDDPAGLRLYVDGVIDAVCDPTSIGSMVNNQVLGIAARPFFHPGQEAFWRGRLDEIEIFRRALSETEIQGIYLAGHSGKCKGGPCEDSIGVPVCEGICPVNQTCAEGTAAMPCQCVPVAETCGGTHPVCNGPCTDPDDICVDDGINCICVTPTLCEEADSPTCDGICPDSDWQCVNNGQRCHCEPLDTPCETSIHPTCGGVCPITGVECVPHPDPLVFECICPSDDPPLCEGFATYPECDGWCPPDKECWNNGQRCHCIPSPHCGDDGDYPTCEGPCPDDFVCEQVAGALSCQCVEVVEVCGDTFYPECGGDCPAGESCKNILGTDNCQCEPDPVACGSALTPECKGDCPVDERCVEVDTPIGTECQCKPCNVVGPDPGTGTGTVLVLAWPGNKGQLRWGPSECALVYNLYRLTGPGLVDADRNGLADVYPGCFQSDIIALEAPDPSVPPLEWLHFYLVTAEDFNVETWLGTNSAGVERPNTAACP